MRHEIRDHIQENPGIHLRELKRNLDCTSTTLNYHIDRLEVKDRKIRGYRRLYPREIPEEMERPLAALNHDVRGPMLYYINNGTPHSELSGKLDLSKSTVSSHLSVLSEDGLVKERKKGRRKKLSVSENSIEALNHYAARILDDASEGFIEMWK
ncbi:MAG: winged helix-turn-helix transcriptional regulator [Candidatus Nanosalina sp.]